MAERKGFETPADPAGSRTQLPHSSAGGRLPSQGQIMSSPQPSSRQPPNLPPPDLPPLSLPPLRLQPLGQPARCSSICVPPPIAFRMAAVLLPPAAILLSPATILLSPGAILISPGAITLPGCRQCRHRCFCHCFHLPSLRSRYHVLKVLAIGRTELRAVASIRVCPMLKKSAIEVSSSNLRLQAGLPHISPGNHRVLVNLDAVLCPQRHPP
jgi:hypothetical protein